MYSDVNKNVTVFALLAHTHLTGREIHTKIVRNNKEVSYLSKNNYYDFNYQNVAFLPKPVVLKKDDEILVNCVYSTMDRKNFTSGGLITSKEMW